MSAADLSAPPPDVFEMVRVDLIAPGVYRGHTLPGPYGRIFGGQLIGQAVMAATHTVDEDRPAHSYRCSFLRMGDTQLPIDYRVEVLRDGRAISVREVRAVQGDRVLMVATVSFHNERGGLEHQLAMGSYPMPETVDPGAVHTPADTQGFEPPHRRAVQLRRIPAHDMPPSDGTPYRAGIWFAPSRSVGEHDPRECRAVMALCSDFTILEVIVTGHGLTFADPRLTVASLDHSFWWHEDFAMDDWLLFVQESAWAGHQRGLVAGRMYDRHGVLRASTAQEGLVRFDDAA